ncbi:hypothetical protein Sjap_002836 [Stephania japonica]|uniref:WRKY domain-containing protein n=1 Tax=Stephania japonica TaxID=461633 RepID=A0AAP0KMT7_9MAGN
MHQSVVSCPSSVRNTSNGCTHNEQSFSALDVDTHSKSSSTSFLSPSISTGPSHRLRQPSIQAEDQPETPASKCKTASGNETMESASSELTSSISGPNHHADVNSISSLPLVVKSVESQKTQCDLVGGLSDDKGLIATDRLLQDGYNWRKYGQKLIKGNNFTRSYYKCSFPNCLVKRQLERSHNGQITEIIYKGQHDHPKPHPTSQTTVRAVHSIQEEIPYKIPFSKCIEERSLNGRDQVSHGAKRNGIHELPHIVASEIDVEDVESQRNKMPKEVDYDNDQESKRRRLEIDGEYTPKSSEASGHRNYERPVQVQGQDSAADMVTSRSIVRFESDSEESRQKCGSDSMVVAVQSDQKDVSPLASAGRFWEDGYNWRKYGQKHIKGSEYPRSYYRCTHPNCSVKKQLERSHDGQIAEVIYKGKHEHPKPQTSSHMAVGRILSIEEEKVESLSTLNSPDEKSLNGHGQTYQDSEPNGTPELALITVNAEDAHGEGLRLNKIDDRDDTDLESKNASSELNDKHSTNSSAAPSLQKCKLSLSLVKENLTPDSHELASSVAARNPPVYMVTLGGIVPVEVESDESRQKQGLDCGVDAQSNHLSPITDERMLENAYHWRKYGQKNIKGSEFPRSYYRCTHRDCQVKMQLERSHDGRIIEIIYKGKHDHPKPQPISRMAIGAILSIEDESSDKLDHSNVKEIKSPNEHGQSIAQTNPNGTHELSPVTANDDDDEGPGDKVRTEIESHDDNNDPEAKRRKKEGGADVAIVARSPREPRLVVETLSKVDVVDDGYRWQKYGRKMVKGNPHPRNYYRCSNAACLVKKHVERASHNPKAVITTYEGKHNHDPPFARVTGHDLTGSANRVAASQTALENDCKQGEAIVIDSGTRKGLGSESRSRGMQQEMGSEPVHREPEIAGQDSRKLTMVDLVTEPNVDLNDGSELVGNKSTDQAPDLSLDTQSLNQSVGLG